jgi:hypothetical protein
LILNHSFLRIKKGKEELSYRKEVKLVSETSPMKLIMISVSKMRRKIKSLRSPMSKESVLSEMSHLSEKEETQSLQVQCSKEVNWTLKSRD